MNNRFNLAVLPRTQRGSGLVLNASPDGKNFIYCHGHSVIIRNLDSPQYADVYTQHATDVNVAKYSPSGFYIASADKAGKVRIWDTVNSEHILKNEFQPISGAIKDLAWSPDNQRIVVVGDGREKFGHVFLADTGTSNGDITGQSRPVNSCDFRPVRPFRIITGSEDNTAAYYEGPPFKFKGTKTEHTRYCQVVRFSPNGKVWVSGGFDGRLFVYDGQDSTLIGEVKQGGDNAHSGGIYGLSFSSDSAQFITASGDKTCRIWDVEKRAPVASYAFGGEVLDQQLGCLWSKSHVLSVSLSGNIHYLDPRTANGITMTINGHNKPITAVSKPADDHRTFMTGDSEGRVCVWQTEQGVATQVEGKGPSNQINAMEACDAKNVIVAAIDDTLRGAADGYYTDVSVKLNSQPRAVKTLGDVTVLATVKSLMLLRHDSVQKERPLDFEPSSLTVQKDVGHIAVGDGSNQGHQVHVFNASTLEPEKSIKATGIVTCVAYSPDGKYLAVGDANRRITVLSVPTYEKAHTREWGFHSAKVTCLAWSPDSKFLASGSLDCGVILWSMDTPQKHSSLPSAHVQSQITGISWMDNATVVTTGQDGNVKVWNVTWKP